MPCRSLLLLLIATLLRRADCYITGISPRRDAASVSLLRFRLPTPAARFHTLQLDFAPIYF